MKKWDTKYAGLVTAAGVGMVVAGLANGRSGLWLPGVAIMTCGVVAYVAIMLRKKG